MHEEVEENEGGEGEERHHRWRLGPEIFPEQGVGRKLDEDEGC